jgi:hypothetical protein
MDHLVSDLRYAIASLRRTPVLTATVLATLALGIGATTAVFTVVHRVLLAPFPGPDRIGSCVCGKDIPAACHPPAIGGSACGHGSPGQAWPPRVS